MTLNYFYFYSSLLAYLSCIFWSSLCFNFDRICTCAAWTAAGSKPVTHGLAKGEFRLLVLFEIHKRFLGDHPVPLYFVTPVDSLGSNNILLLVQAHPLAKWARDAHEWSLWSLLASAHQAAHRGVEEPDLGWAFCVDVSSKAWKMTFMELTFCDRSQNRYSWCEVAYCGLTFILVLNLTRCEFDDLGKTG